MRIHAEEKRAVDIATLTIEADRLTNGEDMPLVECYIE